FQGAERIGDGYAIAVRDEDAILAALDHALVRAIFLEQAVHDPGAARVGQEFAVIADQAARRAREGDARLAAARRAHVGEVGLADLHLLDDRARMFVVDVDDDGFIWFGALDVLVLAIENLRAADAEFEAFA